MSFAAKVLRSKPVIWTFIVLPGLWPAWPLFISQDATARTDPLKFILLHYGLTACLLLVAVLCLTPLRVLFPGSQVALALNRHRRLVGVSSCAYALLHVTVQVLYQYDGTFDGTLVQLATEIQKPFQLTGLAALVILLILAITSLNILVRMLGARNWKRLHRLAYVAAALAAWHQISAHKIFPQQAVWIFGPLLALELSRFWKQRSIVSRAP